MNFVNEPSATGDAPSKRDTERSDAEDDEIIMSIDGLCKYFPVDSGLIPRLSVDWNGRFPSVTAERKYVRAVDDVSFDIKKGETLGLVGESGCGKSTIARTILRLLEPTHGRITFRGTDLATLSGKKLRAQRKHLQMVFQDPQSSLNPRMKIGEIVEEPMEGQKMLDAEGRENRARELLERVGLDPEHYNRYPHEFSGGQRQRVNLARALSVNPDFIVLDEPVASLDVSIQGQVLNTMTELQEEFGVTYLFIAHDLSVIRQISDRVAVMYLGKVVEIGDKEEIFENPSHPYTRALLDSIPIPDSRAEGSRTVLEGDVPSPIDPPSGCRFRTRFPELIAPDEYGFTDEEWQRVKRLVRAVDRELIEPMPPAELKAKYFEGVELSDEASPIIDEAVAAFANEDIEEAKRLLDTSFTTRSICAQAEPELRSHDRDTPTNRVACHLHNEPGAK